MEWWTLLIASFHSGFIILTALCLLTESFLPKGIKRNEVLNFHTAVNLGLAIGVTIELILSARVWLQLYRQRSLYESYTALSTGYVLDKVLFVTTILFWIGALMFYIRKLRINRLLSLMVLIMGISPIFIKWADDAYHFALIPSTIWDWVIQVSLFIGFTGLLYLLMSSMRRLPYNV